VGGIFIAVSSGLPFPESLIRYRGRAYSIIIDGVVVYILFAAALANKNKLKQGEPKSARSSPASFSSAAIADDIVDMEN